MQKRKVCDSVESKAKNKKIKPQLKLFHDKDDVEVGVDEVGMLSVNIVILTVFFFFHFRKRTSIFTCCWCVLHSTKKAFQGHGANSGLKGNKV